MLRLLDVAKGLLTAFSLLDIPNFTTIQGDIGGNWPGLRVRRQVIYRSKHWFVQFGLHDRQQGFCILPVFIRENKQNARFSSSCPQSNPAHVTI